MGLDIELVVIIDEDADEYKRKSIDKLASRVQQFFNDGIMEKTIDAMIEKPLPGEPEGNCLGIATAFMTDLIIAKQAQGWDWVKGVNAEARDHSWLEYNDFAVDATIEQKEKPDQLTISIGEVEFYYKARGITKILRRRNAKQTRKWFFKHAQDKP